MVSRRRLLAAGGTAAVTLAGGYAVAASQTSVPALPDGWPMARGDPGGRSHAPDARPPRAEVAVRWKRQLETHRGFAYGICPVVANGRVYAVGREVLVLDADSGEVVARDDYESFSAPALAPASAYRSPTLALNQDSGLVGRHPDGAPDVFGVGPGGTRWHTARQQHEVSFFDHRPGRQPPVAADGAVVASRSGRVVAVDASSGEVRWRRPSHTDRPVVRDGTVYVVHGLETVRGYDLATGDRQFDVTLDVAAEFSLTAGPDHLIVRDRAGLVGLAYDGTVGWRYRPGEGSFTSGGVALADGVAYGGFELGDEEALVAVDAETGAERWRSPAAPERSPRFAPPAVANGTVYVPTESHRLAAVDADDGAVLWTLDPADDIAPWSPPAIVGDRLYATDAEYVYALEAP